MAGSADKSAVAEVPTNNGLLTRIKEVEVDGWEHGMVDDPLGYVGLRGTGPPKALTKEQVERYDADGYVHDPRWGCRAGRGRAGRAPRARERGAPWCGEDGVRVARGGEEGEEAGTDIAGPCGVAHKHRAAGRAAGARYEGGTEGPRGALRGRRAGRRGRGRRHEGGGALEAG